MSGRKLATFVHVHDTDGTSHAFGPADTVPEKYAKQITNPGAWVAEPDPDPDGSPSESWTVPQLRAYADAEEIDLGDATKKADILAAITEATESDDGNTTV